MTGSEPYPPVHPQQPSQLPVPIEPAWQPRYPVPAQANPVSMPGPAQPYPAPYAAVPVPYPMLRTSGLCVAGMVVGILALVGFWIPVGDVIMGVLGVALSWAGVVQAAKPGFTGRGMGIAGLICGILALIPAIILVILFMTVGFALI